MSIFQLFLLFFLCIFLLSRIPYRVVHFVGAILASFIWMAELSSYVLTSKPFDIVALSHIGIDALMETWAVYKNYWIIYFVTFPVVSICMSRLAGGRRIQALNKKPTAFVASVSICLVCMFFPGGIGRSLGKIIVDGWHARSSVTLEQALSDIGFPPDEYKVPSDIGKPFDKQKNIVILSLESFERMYLDRPQLTPNLNNKLNEWTFLENFASLPQTFPTVSSLYAWHTAIPFNFGAGGISFQNSEAKSIVSVVSILKKAGYSASYVASKPDFVGTNILMEQFGYDTILGRNTDVDSQAPLSPWGLYDKDILSIAKQEYQRLRSTSAPFLLTVSTIDTHYPGLAYDPRISETNFEGEKIEKVVQWVDYLVDDFIAFIEDSGGLEDTQIFIMPDHFSHQPPFADAERGHTC